MRLRRVPGALVALAAAGAAAPAYAQHFEGRASLTGAANYSKTITDAPFPTQLTASGPSLTVSPSVSLVYETPLTLNTFTYGLGLNFVFTPDFELQAGPLSYNNRLTYQGRYTLSELSAVTLSLTLTHAPVNSLSVVSDAAQTTIDPIPSGAAYTLSISGQEGFTRQMTPELSLSQTNGLTYNAPINPLLVQPSTIGVQNALSLQRQFTRDALGVQLSVQTSYFTIGESSNGAVIEPHVQISNSLSLTWNRTINDKFSSAVVLGVTQIVSPGLETPTAVQPTGSLTLNYQLDPAVATLSYSHVGAPNLATGSVNFTDSGMLRFSLPLGTDSGLTATGSGGFTHMTPIGQTNVAATDMLMGDVSLAWRPPTSQSISIGLRGQVQRQSAGLDANGAFTRLSASLNFTYSYPSATAAAPPTLLPPTLGAAMPVYGTTSIGTIEAPVEPPPAPTPEPPAPKP